MYIGSCIRGMKCSQRQDYFIAWTEATPSRSDSGGSTLLPININCGMFMILRVLRIITAYGYGGAKCTSGLGFSFSPVQCARLPKVRADWLSSDSNPLELHVSTNNDAVIASIVVFDPDGGLFGGEVI